MCEICNKKFKNSNGLAKHLRLLHNISLLEYYVKYKNFDIPKCPYCGNNCKIRKGIVFQKTCCSNECVKKSSSNLKHSDETKKVLSEKRKKWLKNNPDKHPWKNNKKFISKPCEKLKKDLIKNNIKFETEITPIQDRGYSIDIAIIEKRIGLEVNGNQHYNSDKTLKEYYVNRKKLIEENGWKLYDIHYTKVYNDNFVDDLIKIINGENVKIDLDFKIFKKTQRYCECGRIMQKYGKNKKCRICTSKSKRKVCRPNKETLIKEIESLGYRGTGRKYDVSDNAIRKWIKQYKVL